MGALVVVNALGSVLNHVLMHQTVIGEEAIKGSETIKRAGELLRAAPLQPIVNASRRRLDAQRREQLDVVLAHVQQHRLDALLLYDLAMGRRQPQAVAIELERRMIERHPDLDPPTRTAPTGRGHPARLPSGTVTFLFAEVEQRHGIHGGEIGDLGDR